MACDHGGEEFVTQVKEDSFRKKRHRKVPDSVQLASDFTQILKAASQYYGVEEKELLRNGDEITSPSMHLSFRPSATDL